MSDTPAAKPEPTPKDLANQAIDLFVQTMARAGMTPIGCTLALQEHQLGALLSMLFESKDGQFSILDVHEFNRRIRASTTRAVKQMTKPRIVVANALHGNGNG